MNASSSKQTTVLVVEDEIDLREIIAFFLNSNFDVNVIEAENGLKAKEIIDTNPNIQLVVSDYNMPELNGGKLFLHLKEINYPAKFVLVSAINPKDAPEFISHFPDGFAEKPSFSSYLKEFMNQFLKDSQPVTSPDKSYVGVPIHLLSLIGTLPCDLFAKLSESKYIKVVNMGDSFNADEIARFSKKGYLQLHVEKIHGPTLFNTLNQGYVTRLSKPELRFSEQIQISTEISSSVRVLASHFGFSKELEQMTKVGVDLAISIIQKNPELKKLLDSVIDQKDGYLSAHSTRITYLANYIAKLMGWDSESTSFKMAFASLIHDSTLQRQFNFHNLTELSLEKSKLEMNPTEFDEFIHHPTNAAKIIEQFKGVPPDVDVIIAQHHESPDGSGFPNKLTYSRIAPLSCVFIVAHDLLEFYELKKNEFLLEDFISIYQTKYSSGIFKKILSQLHLVNFN